MSGVIFWDVDTQVDFMKADGKLYVPDSESIIPTLRALTEFARDRGIRVVASADDHWPDHAELSDAPDWKTTFPPHCMHDTPGQARIPETIPRDALIVEPAPRSAGDVADGVRAHEGTVLLNKHRFDVFTNANAPAVLDALDPDAIVVYGVALDVCVKFAIDGLLAHRPETTLFLVTDATRAIDAEQSEALLAAWQERGVRLVRAADILEGDALAAYLHAGV